ncbi:ribonuclease HII [Candidatus Kaiserbacteria bacterium CG10_big_fil_rev_8_21_14_0_10_56_12]|uniref:Ribonuclease n=1 Tax=Candidatus Kaiserbacteria bacterium CG10_big_fil_rev_8_21_14_0_10_56_12 TaxID=1974611 RepID=A0A2H0UAQ2_9BACT|nr:MAG: ribonuclease HII [Candidatus Kaiserbacteria bacterium CG10_big_fil_rev_8_21_14_0_10_56_12]
MRFMLGVDEAGRGPLAGPVAVGVVAVPVHFEVAREFPGVADSKKLSEKKRETLFALLESRVAQGDVRYVVELESNETIDSEGIVVAVHCALDRGVRALAPDASAVEVLLDGALKAPAEYAQETMIGGDALVPLISLASIAAKVVRDRRMYALAEQYQEYGFDAHKGYGTKAHYQVLQEHGQCALHRKTFLHER